MSSNLTSEERDHLTPLLASIARTIASGQTITEKQLRVLLSATDVHATPVVIQELQRWAKLLKEVYDNPNEGMQRMVAEGLLLRGLPEAPVLLAISAVMQDRASSVQHAPSAASLTVHPERLEWSNLPSGQGVTAELHIEGGPGDIVVESDFVQVSPQQFGYGKTRIGVEVKPVQEGMIWTTIKLITAGQTVEIPVVAQWVSEPVHRSDPSLDHASVDEVILSRQVPSWKKPAETWKKPGETMLPQQVPSPVQSDSSRHRIVGAPPISSTSPSIQPSPPQPAPVKDSVIGVVIGVVIGMGIGAVIGAVIGMGIGMGIGMVIGAVIGAVIAEKIEMWIEQKPPA